MKTFFLVRNRRKIIPRSKIRTLARYLKSQNLRIVFTNGTFDLLHRGHVQYLKAAKRAGDVLIVGVNTDRSVKSYKGPDRPINPQRDRIEVLAALEMVDFAVLFDDPTPIRLIVDIRPDVLVKGSDWKLSQIVGRKEVESWGGLVLRIPLVPGRSTTGLIRRLGSPPSSGVHA
ncbi:MAG: D-glycero-beta-D-manno-heptose 1-phosphate adenylyltransferase [Candidatus Omnitrophica bacterium]|nr:D-glycero-beta-D-manno-heptose 1-phosphate adenylyltransferase [Candidatus Omnitrophota bacterium]